MKNILEEKPTSQLSGRLLESSSFLTETEIKDKSILDVGCGYGWFELALLKFGPKQLIGIEIAEDDLQTAKNNIFDERITFRTGSAIDLPFKDGTFDVVVSWEVIEHIPKNTESMMFSEVARVLKPGGIFCLSTPYNSFLSKILDPAWWLIGHRHYSEEKLSKFGSLYGFKIITFRKKGRIWSLLSTLNMYISKWIFRRERLFKNYFINKDNIEYKRDDGYANIFIKYIKTI